MPNLAQKYEPHDAAEYILKLIPDELCEAGQRVKFSAEMARRYLDLRHLVRPCSTEVFQKQKAAAPKPSFVSIDATGGHSIELLALAVGADLRVNDTPGSEAFVDMGGEKQWCPKCPHKGGNCVCNPYSTKSPPPSMYLNTNRYKELMALRDRNGANETPPMTP